MGESIALVEFSKYGQRSRSKSFEFAHIEVGLKLWNPHRSPDFQHAPGVEGRGYEAPEPGTGNLSVCTNAIATRYGCLAVTLEQPFKDTTFHTPEPKHGWSAPRALKLGAALVDALLDTLPAIEARKADGAGPLQPGVAPLA